MSKSRLEKFLYALYSLDSSDLPNPLSRIEELYKCLVIGEEPPTFEPLSRVEKYLMAILGVYDANELPNPISRVEVLLHKLAIGDDNLDDVKSFPSEHEELLAEIIRNGGAGGNIDIEYVLYTLSTEFNTLYNTAEKPVKSAILKGRTLVNQATTSELTFESAWQGKIIEGNALQSDGKYFVSFDLESDSSELTIQARKDYSFVYHIHKGFTKGKNVLSFILEQDANGLRFQVGNDFNVKISNIIVLEHQVGMENWDIPYFEGMQSVKMPVLTTIGKNLFPTNNFLEYGTDNKMVGRDTFEVYLKSGDYCSSYFHADDSDKNTMLRYRLLDEQDNQVLANGAVDRTFTIENNGLYKLKFGRGSTYTGMLTKIKVQLEEGSVATEYEPYKSTTVTCNEEVELRGIGDVKDELDLMTGEKIERIGEIVLNGSDDLTYTYEAYSNDTTTMVHVPIPNTDKVFNFYNDKLAQKHIYDVTCVDEGVFADWNSLFIRLLNAKLSSPNSDGVKEYLQSDPVTVQYQLATPAIKTVDLSIVDQDGNDTELSTFNDITHVTLSSEELIPEAELEVATKNEEVINTMSLEMDDISATQTTLEETSNTQSENVDATMLATTEIYEQLL